MINKKQHWFCFSFTGSVNGMNGNACTYVGYPRKTITKPMIENQKIQSGLSECVLVSVTYCGHMTKYDFTGGEE